MIELKEVQTEDEIQRTAMLAKEIWQQHFTPIIGADQVVYMLDKFQSAKAMKRQIGQEGWQMEWDSMCLREPCSSGTLSQALRLLL